jgi:hypothetical protein
MRGVSGWLFGEKKHNLHHPKKNPDRQSTPSPPLSGLFSVPVPQKPQLALQISKTRELYENVVPDTPIPGLEPPPNTSFSRFTPCGRYLVAFDVSSNEVVLYSHNGLQMKGDDAWVEAAAAAARGEMVRCDASPQHHADGQGVPSPPSFDHLFTERMRCSMARSNEVLSPFCLVR